MSLLRFILHVVKFAKTHKHSIYYTYVFELFGLDLCHVDVMRPHPVVIPHAVNQVHGNDVQNDGFPALYAGGRGLIGGRV
jgi:hypothetical protein